MISSMTGYGRGESSKKGITAVAELRSVNNRFLEVAARLPRTLNARENDIKELLRKKLVRGKINVNLSVERESGADIPVKVNRSAVMAYYKLLLDLKKMTKSSEKIRLEHLLSFSEILEPETKDEADDLEWQVSEAAINKALDALIMMREKEGGELRKDLRSRLSQLEKLVADSERISKDWLPEERKRLRERVAELLDNPDILDNNRLELEIALLSDKLDITEECVRFRSHIKFFTEALNGSESAGRKLNFLLQEMNREANTIGSKSFDVEIAHSVVVMKEEMEKMREQLQNIE
ncbi:MAG TPA: YicC/YloC family endoribonuclease [Bacteroidota bacterium]|nr:YicC/YloC family endoribonuclease [Bacteroidota bacterium]